ncbi:MAG TPA: cupredoxin domain-containing protein [Patescibacteria group bacterium]
MEKFLVTILGLILISFIYWFFFGKKEEVKAEGETTIVVEGGYKPSVIKVKKGKPVELKFIRKDPNSCLEEIVIPDFKIKKYLPMNEEVKIEITPKEVGEIVFHCGMHMYEGKVVVE